MFDSLKKRLWEVLKEKEVSLAMLFNRQGKIFWHKGREIIGKTIREGEGFSKTLIYKAIEDATEICEKNVFLTLPNTQLPQSAHILRIKSIIIIPIYQDIFLYVDSGIRQEFTSADYEIFKLLGLLIGELIENIIKEELQSEGITGSGSAMAKIRDLVLKYSIEEEPVLLLGESGVGKSHIAELIHRYSGRQGKFFTINTPSIPENLFESEIFGHRKGSFTDARSDKKGYVDEACGGTLFFDEISEIPLSFQAKLLRFIETKKYIPLGETAEKDADVRIIAATNKDIHQAISDKQFRNDLYYRLQVLEITIPPLRERPEDIRDLVNAKIKLLKGKQLGEGFWEAMISYHWPGNIRELITVLTRVGILLESPISGDKIRQIIQQTPCIASPGSNNADDIADRIWQEIRQGENFWNAVKKPFINRDICRCHVNQLIKIGLNHSDGRYKNLIKTFHLKDSDYHRFMTFLSDYKLGSKE